MLTIALMVQKHQPRQQHEPPQPWLCPWKTKQKGQFHLRIFLMNQEQSLLLLNLSLEAHTFLIF